MNDALIGQRDRGNRILKMGGQFLFARAEKLEVLFAQAAVLVELFQQLASDMRTIRRTAAVTAKKNFSAGANRLQQHFIAVANHTGRWLQIGIAADQVIEDCIDWRHKSPG